MTSSFSILVSENLETDDQQCLRDALEHLAHQPISLWQACAVVPIDLGHIDRSVTETIRGRYPWLGIHTVGEPTDYDYRRGARHHTCARGDRDMEYESTWLDSKLAAMDSDLNAGVVAGEVCVTVSCPYTPAVLSTRAALPGASTIDRTR